MTNMVSTVGKLVGEAVKALGTEMGKIANAIEQNTEEVKALKRETAANSFLLSEMIKDARMTTIRKDEILKGYEDIKGGGRCPMKATTKRKIAGGSLRVTSAAVAAGVPLLMLRELAPKWFREQEAGVALTGAGVIGVIILAAVLLSKFHALAKPLLTLLGKVKGPYLMLPDPVRRHVRRVHGGRVSVPADR